MASILKLPDLWRVLREVDLEAIRRDAESRFRVLIVADARADGASLAALLTGDDVPHPWLEVRTPAELDPSGNDLATLTVALVVTPVPDLAPALAEAVGRLSRAAVPVVTVVHGKSRSVDAVPRPGEMVRVPLPGRVEDGVAAVAEALVRAVPAGLRMALARQLPPVRGAAFDLLIEETAKANATYAFTAAMAEAVPVLDVPLNLADMLILTKNQLLMGFKFALGAGKSGRARDVVGEVLGVIGGGFLLRQAARGLVGLIPIAGIVPKVAIAYTGTWAIGRAIVIWATQGRRLSPSAIGRFSKDAAGRGRAFARGLISDRKEKRLLSARAGR
jgi:uncharacterized protein (DUF697 family)